MINKILPTHLNELFVILNYSQRICASTDTGTILDLFLFKQVTTRSNYKLVQWRHHLLNTHLDFWMQPREIVLEMNNSLQNAFHISILASLLPNWTMPKTIKENIFTFILTSSLSLSHCWVWWPLLQSP